MQTASTTAWVNGKQQTQISIYDRGLMYGQSVFETVATVEQKALLLDDHLQRLKRGCDVLGIRVDLNRLSDEINTALEFTEQKAVLRISVTMGEGGRGYKNPDASAATRILSLHEYPTIEKQNYTDGIQLGVADIRLAEQADLAGIKHSNRLEQIIARSQWQEHWQEALLLDQQGHVIEATQSNVFIVSDNELKTPDLTQAGVAGVMRNFVISKAQDIGVNCQIVPLSIDDIKTSDEVFVTNSVIGLWPVKQFHQTQYSGFDVAKKLLTVMQDYGAIPNI